MNEYIEDFRQLIKDRFIKNRPSLPFSEWLTLNFNDISFTGYEFQRKILDDLHPDLVVLKCAQVGLTHVQILKVLAFAKRYQKTTSIFSLPNEKMYKRIAQGRLLPMINSQPVLAATNGEVRSMSTIQIENSWIYVTGCTEGDATSIAADALFHDELDLSPPEMIALFQSRLQNSDYKITQRFSTPSFVGYGVDKAYSVSDQHEYLHRCSSCNHWQAPEFNNRFINIPYDGDLTNLDHEALVEHNIDLDALYVKCEKCGRKLVPAESQWVPKFPSRSTRGYKIRPFTTSRLSVKYVIHQLLKYKSYNNLRGWYNTVLGEPYTDSNNRIDEEDILACMDTAQPVETSSPCYLGVDVGLTCHIVVGDESNIHLLTTVKIEELVPYIQTLMKKYNIVAGAIDRYPYTPTVNNLRELTNKVILPVEYRNTDAVRVVKNENDEVDHAVIDRTRFLDEVSRRIRNRSIKIRGYSDQKSVVISHLRDMVRIDTSDEPPKWVKLTGTDHYFHALAFFMAAPIIHQVFITKSGMDLRSQLFVGGADIYKPNELLTFRRRSIVR